MSAESMTARPHEDIIGSDTSNMHNIPGAENATSGHHYVATRPIDDGGARRSAGPSTPRGEHAGSRYQPLGSGQPRPRDGDRFPATQERTFETTPTQPRADQHAVPPVTPSGAPVLGTPVYDADISAPRTTAAETMTGPDSAETDRNAPGHPMPQLSAAEARRDWKAHFQG